MLAGVLTVLKIIGIVLLVILLVVLVLLLLILFVPIFYKADALVPQSDLEEKFDAEKISASASFSWLLFVIRGGISFPKDKQFTLRVFGIKILPKKEKNGEDEEEKELSEDKESGKSEGTIEMSDMGDLEESENKESLKEDSTNGEPSGEISDEGDSLQEEDSSFGDDAGEEDKSFLDVLWNMIDSIENILKTPINVFEKIQYTISRVCDKIDMIKSTLENDIFKRAFELVRKKLIKIIRMILPDKCDIDVMFGSGDPATTAEIMAVYGMLYPVLSGKVRYTPDFERKVVYADVHLKGHITIFTIVYSAAVCYFNKDVKKTIRRFKKIIKS